MKKIKLESVGVVGEIRANPYKIEKILSDYFTFHYIPDCRLTKKEADIIVIDAPSLENICKIEYPIVRLRPEADERSFVVVTEYLMERKRQEDLGICSISSSAVYGNKGAILFIGGETNLGKTTSALELISEGSFLLYSDEKTLVNLMNANLEGGSRNLSLRKEIIKKRFRGYGEFVKIPFTPSDKPPIKTIILPHLERSSGKPIIQKFDPLDLFWILTKEFCRRIRGNTKFINYYEYLLPSLDTEELSQKRIRLTKEFVKRVAGYYFQGSPNQLVEFINKID